MPRIQKAPSPQQELTNAADARTAAALRKLDAAKARIATLESNNAATLKALEDSRAVRRAPTPQPAQPRKRHRGDIVRFMFGDTHGLHVDQPAFAAMLRDLKAKNPHEVILGGDMVNCGGFLAEKMTLGFVADTTDTYEQDIEMSNTHLDAIQAAAPNARIEYLEGNHEDRVERWAVTRALGRRDDADFLRRLVSPYTLLNLKQRGIDYYRRTEHHDGLNVPGWIKRGKVFFVHEISSANNAASNAVRDSGGSVVYFHTHRADFSPRVTPGEGLTAAWCPGCLCRRQPLWRHTKPTHWTHGYAVQMVSGATGHFSHDTVLIQNGESLRGAVLA